MINLSFFYIYISFKLMLKKDKKIVFIIERIREGETENLKE